MKLTRTQQRQLKTLARHVERVYDTDRIFFEQHPGRKHRVRLASEVEIAHAEITDGEPMTLPPGMRHFAVLRNIVPGVRLRVFVPNTMHAMTDVPEDLAAALFDAAAPANSPDIEAFLRTAFSREGGAA